MCLYSRQILPRRATKDIVCYKVMYKNVDVHSHVISYHTPFQKFIIPVTSLGKVYKAEGNYKKYYYNMAYDVAFGHIGRKWRRITHVDEGYFHAFAKCDYAISNCGHSRCVVRCVIPKDALYWIGIDDICATEMIFEKEIYW